MSLLGGLFSGTTADDGTPVPGWMIAEIADHDARGDCDGHDYEYGRWGGLVCKKCGN